MYIPIPLSGAPRELTSGDVARYLKRIGAGEFHSGPAETLAHLHQRHLLSIPFENLDVLAGVPLRFDLPGVFDKLITRRRGGICLELNLGFAWLLRELGFDVTILVGELSVGWSHSLLLVRTREGEWICDVGYGCYFIHPLPLVPDRVSTQSRGSYRIVGDSNGELGIERSVKGLWRRIITFTLDPPSYAWLAERCLSDLARPGFDLANRRMVQIMLEDGLATLAGDTLHIVTGGDRRESEIVAERVPHYLEHLFDIVL